MSSRHNGNEPRTREAIFDGNSLRTAMRAARKNGYLSQT